MMQEIMDFGIAILIFLATSFSIQYLLFRFDRKQPFYDETFAEPPKMSRMGLNILIAFVIFVILYSLMKLIMA